MEKKPAMCAGSGAEIGGSRIETVQSLGLPLSIECLWTFNFLVVGVWCILIQMCSDRKSLNMGNIDSSLRLSAEHCDSLQIQRIECEHSIQTICGWRRCSCEHLEMIHHELSSCCVFEKRKYSCQTRRRTFTVQLPQLFACRKVRGGGASQASGTTCKCGNVG